MAFDYSVAIKLTVANLASQGIRLLAGDLLGAGRAASNLQSKLSALKLTAVGYGLDKIGAGTLGFLEKSIDASKEYTRQLSLMNAAGMTQKDIAESIGAAWQTTRDVVTTTAADNLKAIRELRSVIGINNMSEVYGVLPAVQRVRGILEAVTGKPQEGVASDMIKAIDLRTKGAMSQSGIERNSDLMARSILAFGGTLNVSDFHMALKQAKSAALSFDDTFVYDYLPTLIQEFKTKGGTGSSAGTALYTLMQTLTGATQVKKSAIPFWIESGLVSQSDVVKNATGQLQFKPGAVKDAALAETDPYLWAQKYGPSIQALADRHHLTLMETINGMFQNRNAQLMMLTFIQKAAQFDRDKKTVEAVGSSYGAYQALLKSNPQLAEQALHNQWQNVLSILGYKILPRLIPYMVKFADKLDSISQWMQKHPNVTGSLVASLVGLGVAFSVLGKVLMTAGIIKFLGIGPGSIAGGLLTIAKVLGTVGAAVGVFTAAYAGTRWVADHFTPKDWTLGGWLYDKIHGTYDPNASGHSGVARGNIQRPVVNVMVHNTLDRNGFATMVTQEQSKAFAQPQTGFGGFDGLQALAPAGGVGDAGF